MDYSSDNSIIKKICNELKTPFYLYDYNTLHDTFNNLKNRLDSSIDLFYSLKTNNNVNIACLFRKWGAGVEVASMGELELALTAGYDKGDIIYSGPGKTQSELEYA